ncbi:SusD/RagB family nutrient-binding outer membrane lipoprotein [Chitinophaga sp. ARDCPP14]|uniref:SusD/RagB family nutrient-binding outer membrane lipoprotein n=1 Tax=Chitinophaga sp. ARDCPP14 TaxID=3391139 RepID=UPI003F521E95
MNKKIIISIIAGSVMLGGSGCKKFLDVNDDPAAATNVTDALLVGGAELTTAFNIAGGYPARTAAFWTQQLGYDQPAPEWDTYKVTASDVDNTWSFDMYPQILNNLKILQDQATTANHPHAAGMGKILMAYNLAVTTDLWNAIPYSQAFTGFENFKPKYDSQESIYTSINTLLDDAIALLAKEDASASVGDKDLIYASDPEKWTAFAYFLKARFALRLTYAPGKVAATQAQAALTALTKAFPDESYNPGVKFESKSGAQAPWSQFTDNNKWGSVAVSSTFIQLLKSTNDPRLSVMVDTALLGGGYRGRIIGDEQINIDSLSAVGKFFAAADQSVYLATYDEQLFIKAEATFLTAGFVAAQPILNSAVQATFTRFGMKPLGADSTAFKTYLAAKCKLTAANAYEVIMTQKYISNYLSLESYNDWRRTNFPKLTVVQNAYQGITTVPRRWVYPASENETNAQPEQPAKVTDRVWWDTKQ